MTSDNLPVDLPVELTADDAAAALDAAAWNDHPGDDAYRRAIGAIREMCAGRESVTVTELNTVIADHVPGPRSVIHTFAGAFGADWGLDAAVKFARTPDAVCTWQWDLSGHNLQVTADGRVVRFQVTAPDAVRAQLQAAARKRIAEARHG